MCQRTEIRCAVILKNMTGIWFAKKDLIMVWQYISKKRSTVQSVHLFYRKRSGKLCVLILWKEINTVWPHIEEKYSDTAFPYMLKKVWNSVCPFIENGLDISFLYHSCILLKRTVLYIVYMLCVKKMIGILYIFTYCEKD